MKYLLVRFLAVMIAVSPFADAAPVIDMHSYAAGSPEQVRFWQENPPLKLIELLRKSEIPTYTVDSICYDYVSPDDIPALIAMLDSTAPCAALWSSPCSVLPWDMSTVGAESAHLVECFRLRMCPAQLSSDRGRNHESLRAWYRVWRLQDQRRFPDLQELLKKAEPGATDNPDDAQRVRED